MESTSLYVHKSDTEKVLKFADILIGDFAQEIKYKSKTPRDVVKVFYSSLVPIEYPVDAANVFVFILDDNKHVYDEIYGSFLYRPREIGIASVKKNGESIYNVWLHIGISWRTISYSAHLSVDNKEIDRTPVYDNETAILQAIAYSYGDIIKDATKDPKQNLFDSVYVKKLEPFLSKS